LLMHRDPADRLAGEQQHPDPEREEPERQRAADGSQDDPRLSGVPAAVRAHARVTARSSATLSQPGCRRSNASYASTAPSTSVIWVTNADGSTTPAAVSSTSSGMYFRWLQFPIVTVRFFIIAAPIGNLLTVGGYTPMSVTVPAFATTSTAQSSTCVGPDPGCQLRCAGARSGTSWSIACSNSSSSASGERSASTPTASITRSGPMPRVISLIN